MTTLPKLLPAGLVAAAALLGALACRGSILNPETEHCEVTSVDSFPMVSAEGDTLYATVTTTWCEWYLRADSMQVQP